MYSTQNPRIAESQNPRIACTLVFAMLEACTAHSDVRFVASPDVHSVGMIKLALGIVLWPFGNCSLVHCGRLVI